MLYLYKRVFGANCHELLATVYTLANVSMFSFALLCMIRKYSLMFIGHRIF